MDTESSRKRNQKPNAYSQIIERVFLTRFREGDLEVEFSRDDIAQAAQELGVPLPKNLGDVVYSFRYRNRLPEFIRQHAPEGVSWIIRPNGIARYKFVTSAYTHITPSNLMSVTTIPDATPGVIAMYSLSDEQALLAKLRYNRLVDVFTGLTCYSLQSHLRTTVHGMGQVETDELYVGLDRRGAQYVLPVQAKGGSDILSVVQIEQDLAMCSAKFPALVCRAIAAQFMAENVIALFEFEATGEQSAGLVRECHYQLVAPDLISNEDLSMYRSRLESP